MAVCVRARVPGPLGMCVRVALLVQHATRMRHIVTSFVVPLAPPHFFALCHKRHEFRKKVTGQMCILIFSTTFI